MQELPENIGESYFFMGDKCYLVTKVLKRKNIVIAKDLSTGKRVSFDYYQWTKHRTKGYSLPETLKIFNRTKWAFYNWVNSGYISEPHHYNLVDPGETDPAKTAKLAIGRNKKGYILKEENLFEIREYLERHSGRKKDTLTIPELKRLLNNNLILWVKTESGEFLPTFRA